MWNFSMASCLLVAPTSILSSMPARPASRSAGVMKCGGFAPTTPRTQLPSVVRTRTSMPMVLPPEKPPRLMKVRVPSAWMDFTMRPTSSPWASSMTTGLVPEKFLGLMKPHMSELRSKSAKGSQNSLTAARVSSSKPEGLLALESLPMRLTTSASSKAMLAASMLEQIMKQIPFRLACRAARGGSRWMIGSHAS